MTIEERIARVEEGMYDQEQCIHILEMQNTPSFATLNNSLEDKEISEIKPEPQWSKRQWAYVQQLLGRLIHVENELMEFKASRKKKRSYRYSNAK